MSQQQVIIWPRGLLRFYNFSLFLRDLPNKEYYNSHMLVVCFPFRRKQMEHILLNDPELVARNDSPRKRPGPLRNRGGLGGRTTRQGVRAEVGVRRLHRSEGWGRRPARGRGCL